jgi:hypothetical protein
MCENDSDGNIKVNKYKQHTEMLHNKNKRNK